MSVKKNLFYNILLVFSQLSFPVIILPYISRILGVDNVGLFSLVDNFVQYFVMLAALGIPIYGIREISQAAIISKEELSIKFSQLITINIIFTILLFFVYLLLIYTSSNILSYKTFYILGLIQFLVSVFSLEWFFQGLENFKFIAIRTFLIKLSSIVLIFLLVNGKADALLYYIISTVAIVTTSCINLFYALRKVTYRLPRLSDLKSHIKPLLTFFTTKFVISMYVTFTVILLGFLSTERDVGFFTLPQKVYNMVIVIVSTLTTVVIARVSILASENNLSQFKELIDKVFSFIISIGFPSSVFIFIYSDAIVGLLGGEEFAPSSLVLKFFSILIFIISLSNVFALNILTPLKKEKYFLSATVTGMVVSLALNFALIPHYGYIGASVGLVVSEVVVFIMLFYFSYKSFAFSFKVKEFLHTFILCIPFYFIFLLVDLYFYNALFILSFGAIISIIYYVFFQIYILKNSLWRLYYNQLLNRIIPYKKIL